VIIFLQIFYFAFKYKNEKKRKKNQNLPNFVAKIKQAQNLNPHLVSKNKIYDKGRQADGQMK
jgi:hypothetical protein